MAAEFCEDVKGGQYSAERVLPSIWTELPLLNNCEDLWGRTTTSEQDSPDRKTVTSVINFGMDAPLGRNIYELLLNNSVDAIHAIDVIGPRAWCDSATYSYLAPQLRQYFLRGGTFAGSKEVLMAIKKSIANAVKCNDAYFPISSSRSKIAAAFASRTADAQKALTLENARAPLCLSRLLLWSIDELISPEGSNVISFHEELHIPLFFLNVEELDRRRSVDFIVFDLGRYFSVYFGHREQGFETHHDYREVPRIGNPLKYYYNLLLDDMLLLAEDAHWLYAGHASQDD